MTAKERVKAKAVLCRNVRGYIKRHMLQITDYDYAEYITDAITDEVAEDMLETSDCVNTGEWSFGDADRAIGRVLCKRLGIEV